MATERELELLDDYISNRLTGETKTDFEERLRQDPDLQSEFASQRQIADAIRKARSRQLKSMLSAVEVPTVAAEGTGYGKFAATALAVILGLSLLFYIKHSSKNGEQAQQASPEAQAQESVVSDEVTTIAPAEENQVTSQPTPTQERKPKAIKKEAEKSASQTLNVFDPTEEDESDENVPVTVDLPDDVRINHSDMAVEREPNHRKYDFHYVLTDERLVLYGSFEKNLYEILEFFTEEKRTVFLHYKNTYYLLRAGNGKVSPLVPVNDPVLLKKLREHRSAQ